MCGIFFYASVLPIKGKQKSQIESRFAKLRHRGPDESSVNYYNSNAMIGFHRLAIMSPLHSGMQPFHSPSNRYALITNGEIYNFEQLQKELKKCKNCDFKPVTGSDCEVLLPLFLHLLHERPEKTHFEAFKSLCDSLDAEFAIVLYDTESQLVYFGVDQLRIRPMFLALDEKGGFYISSEQKPLAHLPLISPVPAGCCGRFELTRDRAEAAPKQPKLPNGSQNCSIDRSIKEKLRRKWRKIYPGDPEPDMARLFVTSHFDFDRLRDAKPRGDLSFKTASARLRELLVENIKAKLNPEREFAFLLSGGLDSSLVCSVASKLLAPRRIRTFTFGFSRDAPDVKAAEEVANHINSIHETFLFDFEEGSALLEDEVVYYAETWDQTTIRASTVMLLGLKRIRAELPTLAVLYSGEVADELLRGYLYNLSSPDPEAGRADALDLLRNVSYFDGLRADRMVSRVSCELRLPFFGKSLLEFVFSLPAEFLDPKLNGNVEKKLLRAAFDSDERGRKLGYLPEHLLWRTKHAFSDATSERGGWKSSLARVAEERVSDSRFGARNVIYDYCEPQTKEDMWYREMFDRFGYCEQSIPRKWMPRWSGECTDSSAMALDVFHEDGFD